MLGQGVPELTGEGVAQGIGRGEGGDRGLLHHRAVAEDGDAIGHGERQLDVVGDEHDAAASVGTNRLLARGEAICVCSGADVLEHYRALYPQQVKETAISDAIQSQRLSNPPEEPEVRAKPTSPAEPESSIPSDSSLSTAPAPSGAPALREIRLSEHASEFTDDEQAILNALADGEQITDTIVDATGIPARRVSAALTVLTIRALVRQKSGGRFEALVKLI